MSAALDRIWNRSICKELNVPHGTTGGLLRIPEVPRGTFPRNPQHSETGWVISEVDFA